MRFTGRNLECRECGHSDMHTVVPGLKSNDWPRRVMGCKSCLYGYCLLPGTCQVLDSSGLPCESPARYRIIQPWDALETCTADFPIAFGEMVSPSRDGRAIVEYYND